MKKKKRLCDNKSWIKHTRAAASRDRFGCSLSSVGISPKQSVKRSFPCPVLCSPAVLRKVSKHRWRQDNTQRPQSISEKDSVVESHGCAKNRLTKRLVYDCIPRGPLLKCEREIVSNNKQAKRKRTIVWKNTQCVEEIRGQSSRPGKEPRPGR